MNNSIRIVRCILVFVFLVTTSAVVTHAQAIRTWVSGVGDDVNPCSRTAPCKTFAGAISKTAMGGEICALDPGGFGTVTITKSITLEGTGNIAGIAANTTTGININLTDPKDDAKAVRVRGLVIDGFGSGVTGINIVAANNVVVEDTVIDGFATGIKVQAGSLFVKNSSIRNNRDAGIGVSGGDLGLMRVSLTYNGAALAGTFTSMTWLSDVVLYGNKKGDAKPPGVK